MRGIRWKITSLVAIAFVTGCVGPGQNVRGGHYRGHGGHYHHSSGGGGLLALLEGVSLIADIAADVSETQAALDSQRRVAVVAPPPPPPEQVRPLPPWYQGRVLLPNARATLPEIHIGVRPLSGGPFLAILDSDSLGRFSFAVPPAGPYHLVVLDPEYQGEMAFASDGRTAFPLEFPISPRKQQVPGISPTPPAS